MDSVSFETTPIDSYLSRQAWDAAATDLVATMLSRWHLTASGAFIGGEAGSTLRVTTATGERAVLKVGFPHVEGIWEAVGLEAWGEPLAPAVLRQDPWTWSLLLGAVEPGTPLSRAALPSREALAFGAELLGRLVAVTAPPELPTLDELMRQFVQSARAHSDLAAEGLGVFGALLDADTGDGFLHGDFNPGNVLLGDGRWVAIDPKPMRGDPAFDVWPLVGQLGALWTAPHPEHLLAEQLELVASVSGIDAERAARWGFARSALTACWFRAEGGGAAAARAERETAAWRAIL